MDQHARLREIVARLSRVEPDAISSGYSLEPLLAGSINVHLLESAIRQHLKIVPPPLHGVRTFAQLEASLFGAEGQTPPPASVPAGSSAATSPAASQAADDQAAPELSCGLDVESISSLPAAEDYWTHEFYVNTFTPAEIAYCTRQTAPLRHFAAHWCAKEALKKCDAAFLTQPMTALQVTHDEQGAPVLQVVSTQRILPYAVSLTHSGDTAAAVVARIRPPAAAPPASSGSAIPMAAPVQALPERVFPIGTAVAVLLGLLSLIVSVLALSR